MHILSEGLLWYLAFLFSVVVHEASHAFTAMKLGDKTAYEGGPLSDYLWPGRCLTISSIRCICCSSTYCTPTMGTL
jgi:hypothetical protein